MATWLFPEATADAGEGKGGRGRRGGRNLLGADWRKPLPLLCLLAVLAGAFWATFRLGRIGFMSLDMPITWDAAWRMMNGQWPCRDFNTPGDVLPALIQIVFFKVCGVNWWGYLVHAGLCNAAFALGVMLFLSRMGAPVLLSLFVGAMEGWHFNTPIGIPYYDQYSYFFAFFALAAFTLGVLDRNLMLRGIFLLLVPPLCVATILSKVSPGLYALALLPGIFVVSCRRGERWDAIGVLVASSILTVLGLGLLCWYGGVAPDRVWESFFGLPSGIGHERWAAVRWEDWRLQAEWRMGRLAGLWIALPAGLAAAVALLVRRERGMAGSRYVKPENDLRRDRIRALIWITLAAPWVDLVTFLSADQQALNYLAYGVLALGTGLTAFGLAAGRGVAARTVYVAAFCLMVAVTVRVELGTAWKMVLRNVNDFGLPESTKLSEFPPAGRELAPMIWINSNGQYSAEEFWRVVDFLKEKNEPFLIAGQNTLPYAFCGRVNPFPIAWLHRGLTFPKPEDPRRPAFDAWAIERLKAAGIRWMAVDSTWGNWLGDLPFLQAWADRATGPEVRIASWRLIPVDVALLGLPAEATPTPAPPSDAVPPAAP
ncbi:hypothetical protein SAMN05444156_1569 [Verrucomicrobium sp. GAS474]|uniref:hypothetical protein n=1 Tax=Verrucomicrobium sp. GAS474 TaxID=1882831 RepID=UPI00087BD3C4|nr:hypothetical protein [Verrucomicrobium sp. GAS474]SDU03380.1 hypothetical protein SAMN05444156_1569 [Verrucomicrobium sp. GAS474]